MKIPSTGAGVYLPNFRINDPNDSSDAERLGLPWVDLSCLSAQFHTCPVTKVQQFFLMHHKPSIGM